MAVAKVFFDVSMGYGLPGLTEIARQKKFKVGDGKFGLFMNRKRTKVKILFDEQTLVSYSKSSGGQITLEELKALPLTFRGEWITDTIGKSIEKWLATPVTEYSESIKVA